MSELSIFIDESGDFGEVKERPAYYLVTMVFHNQAIDITKEIYQCANIQPSKAGNITGHEIQSETSIAHLCTTATQAAINNK